MLYNLADRLSELLLSIRNVVALNQDLINTSSSGHYDFKGFVPAVVGTQVGNDFFLKTNIRIKQTSLKIRNPQNTPDEWEKEALERFEIPDYPKGVPITEVVTAGGESVYRFIKPIYVGKACLRCHSEKLEIPKDIRDYLERHYPSDAATGYKEGELRGGISITIPMARPAPAKPSQP